MRLRWIDVRGKGRTIADAGGEDRALLRSNPSAYAGAGTRPEGLLTRQPSASPNVPDAFWPQSDKPRGLGQSPKATPRTGATYVNIERLIDSSRGQVRRRRTPPTDFAFRDDPPDPEKGRTKRAGAGQPFQGWVSRRRWFRWRRPPAADLPPATFEQAFSLQQIRVHVLVQAAPSPPLGADLGFSEQLNRRRA